MSTFEILIWASLPDLKILFIICTTLSALITLAGVGSLGNGTLEERYIIIFLLVTLLFAFIACILPGSETVEVLLDHTLKTSGGCSGD